MFDSKNNAEKLMGALVSDLQKAARENSKNGICDYSEDTLFRLERIQNLLPAWSLDATPFDYL